jgi:hypothetical protein
MMFYVVLLGVVGCTSAVMSKPHTTLDIEQHLGDFFPKNRNNNDVSFKTLPSSMLEGNDAGKMLHFAYSYSDRCDEQLFFMDQVISLPRSFLSHLLSLDEYFRMNYWKY